MAGFLDPDRDVLDVVLTQEGRAALAAGRLVFASWAPFDDGVDYDPYLPTSGSMSADALSDARLESIELTPMLECIPGRRVLDRMGRSTVGPFDPIFSVVSDATVVPRLVASTGSFSVAITQLPNGGLISRVARRPSRCRSTTAAEHHSPTAHRSRYARSIPGLMG